jgi:hypothetical protein
MAMKDWLLMTWDKAHQIEVVINDARVNRLRGSGSSAKNSLASIFWYIDITKIIYAIFARFGYEKVYMALKELAENNGVKFYKLQRFCDTIIAQIRTKIVCQLHERLFFCLAGSRGACERSRGRVTCNL